MADIVGLGSWFAGWLGLFASVSMGLDSGWGKYSRNTYIYLLDWYDVGNGIMAYFCTDDDTSAL